MDDNVMNMTVEQFEQLLNALSTQGGSNAAILVFTGIAALAGVIFVMWWVLNLKLAPIEKMCESLETAIKELNTEVNTLSKKIWEPDTLNNKIKLQIAEAIQEHEQKCSCRNCKNIQ